MFQLIGAVILIAVLGIVCLIVFNRRTCKHKYVKMRVDENGNHVKAISVKVSFADSLNGVNRPFDKCKKCGHIKLKVIRQHPTEEELLNV